MGISGTGRHDRQMRVPPRQKFLLEVLIGLLQRADAGQTHPLHQTILGCAKTSLDSSLCLWTVCRNPDDLKLLKGTSNLCWRQRRPLARRDLPVVAAAFGSGLKQARFVGVKRDWPAVPFQVRR